MTNFTVFLKIEPRLIITTETLPAHLIFPALLFLTSMCIVLWNWRNLLITLLGIETMYFTITMHFILIGWSTYEVLGHVYSLLIVVLAAAESAVGLGLLVVLYRFGNSIEFSEHDQIRG